MRFLLLPSYPDSASEVPDRNGAKRNLAQIIRHRYSKFTFILLKFHILRLRYDIIGAKRLLYH